MTPDKVRAYGVVLLGLVVITWELVVEPTPRPIMVGAGLVLLGFSLPGFWGRGGSDK